MSIHCLSHVMKHSDATLGARLVLFVLAEHAHDDGSESYPAVDTIAERARMSRKGVQGALRRLEAEGSIVRDGLGPRGQSKWRVTMGGEPSSPREDRGSRGANDSAEGGERATPEPSIEPSMEAPTSDRARADVVHKLPDDLPSHLTEQATAAARILYRAARARGQTRPVLLEAVGRAVATNPTKDHVEVAGRVEHWLCWGNGQTKPCKDIVARFRDWLPDSADVRLPDGAAIAEAPAAPDGVTPIRRFGGRQSNAEQVEAQIQALRGMQRPSAG